MSKLYLILKLIFKPFFLLIVSIFCLYVVFIFPKMSHRLQHLRTDYLVLAFIYILLLLVLLLLVLFVVVVVVVVVIVVLLLLLLF